MFRPAPETILSFSGPRMRSGFLFHQPPHPQHDQNPDGSSKGIVDHIIELKQSAEAHQLGQFNQHGIPRCKAHGLPPRSQQPHGNEQDDIQKNLHPERLHPVGPERNQLIGHLRPRRSVQHRDSQDQKQIPGQQPGVPLPSPDLDQNLDSNSKQIIKRINIRNTKCVVDSGTPC